MGVGSQEMATRVKSKSSVSSQVFNDSYLFEWIDGSLDQRKQNSFSNWFDDSEGFLGGIKPFPPLEFGSWAPSNEDVAKKISEMRLVVPPWYWHRLRFCAFHFFTFWNFLWPGFAEVTNEMCFLEWLLHVEPGNLKYRDHLLHMFKVACIGTWLINQKPFAYRLREEIGSPLHWETTESWVKRNGSFHSNFPRNLGTSKAEKSNFETVVKWAFRLSALLHDFGYGYSFRRDFDACTSRMNRWMSNSCFNSEPSLHSHGLFEKSLAAHNIRKWLGEGDHLDRRLSGLVRDNLLLNHSFASMLFVLDLENELIKTGSVNDQMRLALQMAAEAIMIHDLMGIPFTHVLAICRK